MSRHIYDKTYCNGRLRIPDHMKEGLRLYVEEHQPPGDFLRAVICNDLQEAVCRADSENLENLPAYVLFFYNEVDARCWGSKERMEAWLKMGEDSDDNPE